MSKKSDQGNGGQESATYEWWPTVKEIGLFVVGVGILAGFALFMMFLLQWLSLGDSEWNRAIYLLGGVEAIAFAAAGYFFGKEINRKRAESAEASATNLAAAATSKAEDAAGSEARGQALRAAIEARKGWLAGPLGTKEAKPPEAVIDELAVLAEKLFPSPG